MVMRSRVTGAAQRGTGRRAEEPVDDETVIDTQDTATEGAEDAEDPTADDAAPPAAIGRRGTVRSPGANTRVPRGTAPDDNADEPVTKRAPKAARAKAKSGKVAVYGSATEVRAAMKELDVEIKSTIGAHNDRMKELRAKHAELAGHLFDHTSR